MFAKLISDEPQERGGEASPGNSGRGEVGGEDEGNFVRNKCKGQIIIVK